MAAILFPDLDHSRSIRGHLLLVTNIIFSLIIL